MLRATKHVRNILVTKRRATNNSINYFQNHELNKPASQLFHNCKRRNYSILSSTTTRVSQHQTKSLQSPYMIFVLSNSNKNHHQLLHSRNLSSSSSSVEEINRLKLIRNVGIMAHVDAGKTTLTERMLSIAGVITRIGNVDDGNTVTDFLPQERERGITIQSAAISFFWDWHNSPYFTNENNENELMKQKQQKRQKKKEEVKVNLIDTPGHVDFSLEVNRSVAVLDGAVLVLDSVAGVQAQTETVWRSLSGQYQQHTSNNTENVIVQQNEPLACVAMINKMDKDGCNFNNAVNSIKRKLVGAQPFPIQIPLFQISGSSNLQENVNNNDNETGIPSNIVAVGLDMDSGGDGTKGADILSTGTASFVGVVDLVHMRAIVYPPSSSSSSSSSCDPDDYIPTIYNLTSQTSQSQVHKTAQQSRMELIAHLADSNEIVADFYLEEQEPPTDILLQAIREATLSRDMIPVLACAALKGKGVEPLIDAVADYLPSPLDRLPPKLTVLTNNLNSSSGKGGGGGKNKKKKKKKGIKVASPTENTDKKEIIPIGHPLHPSLVAFAYKVVHMKNKGGSGDGRVVFARVYSGKLPTRSVLKVISSSSSSALNTAEVDESSTKQTRVIERVSGMLELNGGIFGNFEDGICESGEVCALVGLKNTVTGDTLLLNSTTSSSNKTDNNLSSIEEFSPNGEHYCLASSLNTPKPVLTVRVETSSSEEQNRLTHALSLIEVEDPSIVVSVDENSGSTLISGLGELHIDVLVDRLKREFGLEEVYTGSPSVTYRECLNTIVDSKNLIQYDRTVGGVRLEASVHIILEPEYQDMDESTNICTLSEPTVHIGEKAREYLELDSSESEEELYQYDELARALISGCEGALRRGSPRIPITPISASNRGPITMKESYPFSNVRVEIVDVHAEGGLNYLHSMPGALRACVSHAIASVLSGDRGDNNIRTDILEPCMALEVYIPSDKVGTITSDLQSTRRGIVSDVNMGTTTSDEKAVVKAYVPLVEILGYANTLRSMTGGEGTFSAEYKGHIPKDNV